MTVTLSGVSHRTYFTVKSVDAQKAVGQKFSSASADVLHSYTTAMGPGVLMAVDDWLHSAHGRMDKSGVWADSSGYGLAVFHEIQGPCINLLLTVASMSQVDRLASALNGLSVLASALNCAKWGRLEAASSASYAWGSTFECDFEGKVPNSYSSGDAPGRMEGQQREDKIASIVAGGGNAPGRMEGQQREDKIASIVAGGGNAPGVATTEARYLKCLAGLAKLDPGAKKLKGWKTDPLLQKLQLETVGEAATYIKDCGWSVVRDLSKGSTGHGVLTIRHPSGRMARPDSLIGAIREIDASGITPSPKKQKLATSGCSVCGGHEDEGLLLDCDGCKRAFHFNGHCHSLLEAPPGNEWLCGECEAEAEAEAMA